MGHYYNLPLNKGQINYFSLLYEEARKVTIKVKLLFEVVILYSFFDIVISNLNKKSLPLINNFSN